jgi:hypothetical protein
MISQVVPIIFNIGQPFPRLPIVGVHVGFIPLSGVDENDSSLVQYREN